MVLLPKKTGRSAIPVVVFAKPKQPLPRPAGKAKKGKTVRPAASPPQAPTSPLPSPPSSRRPRPARPPRVPVSLERKRDEIKSYLKVIADYIEGNYSTYLYPGDGIISGRITVNLIGNASAKDMFLEASDALEDMRNAAFYNDTWVRTRVVYNAVNLDIKSPLDKSKPNQPSVDTKWYRHGFDRAVSYMTQKIIPDVNQYLQELSACEASRSCS